jgi:hypothetical protein
MPDVLLFDFGNRGRMAEISLPLLPFARQQMALESLVAFHLAASGHPKPFRRRSIRFNLRHLSLLFAELNSYPSNNSNLLTTLNQEP